MSVSSFFSQARSRNTVNFMGVGEGGGGRGISQRCAKSVAPASILLNLWALSLTCVWVCGQLLQWVRVTAYSAYYLRLSTADGFLTSAKYPLLHRVYRHYSRRLHIRLGGGGEFFLGRFTSSFIEALIQFMLLSVEYFIPFFILKNPVRSVNQTRAVGVRAGCLSSGHLHPPTKEMCHH